MIGWIGSKFSAFVHWVRVQIRFEDFFLRPCCADLRSLGFKEKKGFKKYAVGVHWVKQNLSGFSLEWISKFSVRGIDFDDIARGEIIRKMLETVLSF